MREIKVDPYGIKIMAPKALTFLIKINSVSNIAANILKQEMLSLGGDVAIAKEAITGKAKKPDCLLIGNLSQFRSLHSKLSFQPFGLAKLAQDIPTALSNYQKNNFDVDFGRFKLNFSP
ncbi:MAG: dihydropteroate synthase, partial [Candidatus Omnitrophota bacterium]